jgi:hypothetical protein
VDELLRHELLQGGRRAVVEVCLLSGASPESFQQRQDVTVSDYMQCAVACTTDTRSYHATTVAMSSTWHTQLPPLLSCELVSVAVSLC